jgi:hypothetical protein
MNGEIIHKVIATWKVDYFTVPYILLCNLTALFFFQIFYKKDKINSLLYIYIVSSLLLFTYGTLQSIRYFGNAFQNHTIFESVNVLFQMLEYGILLKILYSVVKNQKRKKILVLSSFLFLFGLFFFFYVLCSSPHNILEIRSSSNIISAISFTSFLLGCLLYYFDLFDDKCGESLLKRPAFWIVTGIFFYSLYSLPFVIVTETFRSINKNYLNLAITMHYFLFGTNSLMFAIAFKWRSLITI